MPWSAAKGVRKHRHKQTLKSLTMGTFIVKTFTVVKDYDGVRSGKKIIKLHALNVHEYMRCLVVGGA